METLLAVGLWNAVGATALALVAACVGRVCRRPAMLHALWLLVLLKLITPPLWSVAIPVATPHPITVAEPDLPLQTLVFGQPTTQEIREEVPQPPVDQVPVFDTPPLVQTLPDVNLEPDPEPLPASSWPWLETILAVWAGGAILCWCLGALHVARFHRMLRRLCPAPQDLQERVNHLATKVGLRRGPVVYLVAAPISPMVWAITGRARLLVPQILWEGLSDAQRDLMLVHEMAHLRRRDHLVRLLELLIVGLYWWFPVAWLARRRLQEAAELCCDAWVVAIFPQAGEDYAATLVDSASYLSQNAVPLPAGASGLGPVPLLRRRITMILNDKIPARLSWTAMVLVLAAAAALLPLWPTLAEPLAVPEAVVADNSEAQRDLNIARFWERAGHPGSARFYYQIVQRRYPGTTEAEEAGKQLIELEGKAAPQPQQVQPPIMVPLPPGQPPQPVPAPQQVIFGSDVLAGYRDEIELLKVKCQIETARLDLAEAELNAAAQRHKLNEKLTAEGNVNASTVLTTKQEVESRSAAVRVQKAQLQYAELELKQAIRRLADMVPAVPPPPAKPATNPKTANKSSVVNPLVKDKMPDPLNPPPDVKPAPVPQIVKPTPVPQSEYGRVKDLENKIAPLMRELEEVRRQMTNRKDPPPFPNDKDTLEGPQNSRQWGPWGILRKTTILKEGQPLYRFESQDGELFWYAMAARGLTLEPHLGKYICLYGTPPQSISGNRRVALYTIVSTLAYPPPPDR